ncbi:hypothetical protein [Priestia endophytica]|uniref:hypothetical protein n=1 Tax=Priestia endophytica TaxID=135735 RepID=UPI000F542F6A|nr:hypothetical protein [Priestia endophytica]RPK08300.1 hypothetical protein FH5_04930 [Priestia endophytica]
METYEKEIREILVSVKETADMMKEDNFRLDNITELVENNAEKAEKILAMIDETSKGLSRLEETMDRMDKSLLKKMNQKSEIMEILNRINDCLESRTPASEIIESIYGEEDK